MGKKLTYEFVKKSFEDEGYTLLSKKYKNGTKIEYLCPRGHKHHIVWGSWQQGRRCPYCSGKAKPTIDHIRKSFSNENYILISDKYINNSTKLNYICPNGHEHSIRWNDWVDGHRCAYCSGNGKPSIEYLRNSFKSEGYTLLSTEYKNSKQKLNYICPNDHKYYVDWDSWKSGTRCSYCSRKAKPTIEYIRKEFKKENYILLSNEYINSRTKLKYRCPEDHEHSISWTSWYSGQRCPYCAGNAKYTIGYVITFFEKEGYELLSKEYKSNHDLLDYICPNGHRHSISLSAWLRGIRCIECYGNKKFTLNYIKESFEKEGYKLLSKDYKNSKTKLKYICPYDHKHSTTWNTWDSGCRCPTCKSINMSGPNHPNWQGGISFEPYCEAWKDKEYKQDIRDRDGNKCLNPYCNSPNAKDLTIHHVDYNKKNCSPKNLITVCRSCNSKANTNRSWHKSWYQAILHNRYGYSY